MRRRSYGAAGLISICAAIVFGLALVPKNRAQSSCSNQTLSGPYAYSDSGFYGGPGGALYVFAVAGIIIPDGNGGFTSLDTVSQNGVVTRNRAMSGVYQVGPACIGSLSYVTGGQVVATSDFVVANAGQTVRFVQSDSGTAISGTAEKQNPFGS